MTAACFQLVAVGNLAAFGDGALRTRFEKESPAAWSEFESLCKHIDVRLRRISLGREEGREVEVLYGTKVSGPNFLHTIHYLRMPPGQDPVGQQKVVCRNTRYAFELTRAHPDRPWLVEYFGSDVEDIGKLLTSMGAETLPRSPLYVLTTYLPDMVREPGFRVLDVKPVARQSAPLAALKFERGQPTGQKVSHWIRDGVILLNPQRMWTIQEYDIAVTYTPTGDVQQWSQRSEFKQSPDDFPLLTKKEELNLGADGRKILGGSNNIFEIFERRDIQEREFTLSAFGLPEISQPSIWSSGWTWLILMAFGVLCVAIALVMRRHAVAA